MRAPRLVVLGRQGAGKGTQAMRLAADLDLDHVSTGDLFRAAVRSNSALGREVRSYLDEGRLVPDRVVLDVVAERLRGCARERRGFVLDGYPRTLAQGDDLFALLGDDVLDLAIEIDVPPDVVITRLAARRVCRGCGRTFTATDGRGRERWACEACGGVVERRDDDTEEAIRTRLGVYDRETAALVLWLYDRGMLGSVPGTGTPDEVAARIRNVVASRVALPAPARR